MPPRKATKKDGKKEKERPKSENSSRAASRISAATKGKESPVLSDSSLTVLAKDIGIEGYNGLVLSMLLNVPNTDVVRLANAASDVGLRGASDAVKVATTEKLLLLWKKQREHARSRDKVRDMDRALRQLGKKDRADVFSEKHANQQELTADAFANL